MDQQSALDLRRTAVADYRVCVCTIYLFSERSARYPASKVLLVQAQPAGDKAGVHRKSSSCSVSGAKSFLTRPGFSQLRAASEELQLGSELRRNAKIFRAGCIIRAQFLQKITDAYAEKSVDPNLLRWLHTSKQIADDYQQALRDVVVYAVQNGIPFRPSLLRFAYYDSYRAAVLPANLIRAQRDYFGAHTYKRIDKEGVFHTEWLD